MHISPSPAFYDVDEDASILCKASVKCGPLTNLTFQWARKGNAQLPVNRTSINNKGENSSLFLRRLTHGDSGEYICKARQIRAGISAVLVQATVNISVGKLASSEGCVSTLTFYQLDLFNF